MKPAKPASTKIRAKKRGVAMRREMWTRLRELIDQRSLKIIPSGDDPMTLSTGALTRFYFDCKVLTLDGEGLSLVADAFIEAMQKLPERPRAIGGLTMGADFITAAVAMKTYDKGLARVSGSIARKEPKKHGTMKKIENELPPGTPIVVIDDVITTGNSTRLACKEFRAAGYRIIGIIALIDREEADGKVSLEKEFGPVIALFKRSDFPRAVQADEPLRADKGRFAAAA